MPKFLKSAAAFPMLACAVAGLCLGARAESPAAEGRSANVALVVPALPDVIQFAFDLAARRDVTLVSFRNSNEKAGTLIFVWKNNEWRHVTYGDFAALKFAAGQPRAAVVVGEDVSVPVEVLQSAAWHCPVERIRSVQPGDLADGLDKYFHFSRSEREELARQRYPIPAEPAVTRRTDTSTQKVLLTPEAQAAIETRTSSRTEQGSAEGTRWMPGPAPDELCVDLGGDVRLVFVRIEPLKLWVGKHEVTNAQYKKFNLAHDPKRYYDHVLNLPDQPAVLVSWEDANNYCGWLNRHFGGGISTNHEFRLPFEREWVAFAACGGASKYPWGDEWPPPDSFNYQGEEGYSFIYSLFHDTKYIRGHRDKFIVTAPVAHSGVNAWGLYGVGGNVWEWCQDWHDSARTARSLRGAAWNNYESDILAIANRTGAAPEKSNAMIGFRVVLALRPEAR